MNLATDKLPLAHVIGVQKDTAIEETKLNDAIRHKNKGSCTIESKYT